MLVDVEEELMQGTDGRRAIIDSGAETRDDAGAWVELEQTETLDTRQSTDTY